MIQKLYPIDFWDYQFLANSFGVWADSAAVFIVLVILFGIFHKIIINRLRKLADKTETDIDDTLVEIVNSVRPPFYSYLAFYLAFRFLAVPPFIDRLVGVILVIWITYQVIKALHILINYIVHKSLKERGGEEMNSALNVISYVSKITLWSLGLLVILSNLGVNVTSLIAGLGIGGIAVAFAMQNILSDLFSSFAIFFDKPFVEGDFIIVGDKLGTVEKIGIQTTRLRALRGEEIIISNKELTSAQIQNFKKMRERRVTFNFGVLYETPAEKLKLIPQTVEQIIQSVDLTRFDRAHFYKFDDSSLGFEAVYYVNTPDYNKYMDINQEIHFKTRDKFQELGISMAYPTRTVYMHNIKK